MIKPGWRRRPRIDERFVVVPRADVHTVEIDGEAVLLDEASGWIHLLNATGALVWACLDGMSPISEIVTDLSEGLGVPRTLVRADTLGIIRQLGDEGLLANVKPAAGHERPRHATSTRDELPTDPRFVHERPDP